ncbi:hypothetical protein [Myxococcus qinghaiensis]|uniref:hypothetical protein n=1 Tax=Myxococcus qinghaiensis TaxID=2906758 RepID=UPI0020A7439F|nr:hypothetical protein [Myxococcus qinghaiensis]MCP3163334.1 hypothetical protein [Myxococcus qinghaiensis]
MILLVSYDLKGPERPADYERVKEFIEKNSKSFQRPLYSQWLVETTNNCKWWTDQLEKVTDTDDRFFVCKVFPDNYWGFLDKPIWEWMSPRL